MVAKTDSEKVATVMRFVMPHIPEDARPRVRAQIEAAMTDVLSDVTRLSVVGRASSCLDHVSKWLPAFARHILMARVSCHLHAVREETLREVRDHIVASGKSPAILDALPSIPASEARLELIEALATSLEIASSTVLTDAEAALAITDCVKGAIAQCRQTK